MKALFNYFVMTTWQYGKDQFSRVVRVPIGDDAISSSDTQYWTGARWDRREKFAKTYAARSQAATRAMNSIANKERS